MSIAIAGTKRTPEGLYVMARLTEASVECLLVVRAETADGCEVPARVLHGDGDGMWLVVLPALSVTQVLSLSSQSDAGETVEQLTQRINPLAARLPSPAEALVRRGAPSMARVPEVREALGEWDITVDRMIAVKDELDVCQGHATLTSAHVHALEGELEVCPLDSKGHPTSSLPWICLADEVRPLESYPGFFERRIEFSVRVPQAVTTLVLWVKPQEPATLPTGMVCLPPRELAGLRELWKVRTTAAHDDESYDHWFVTEHAVSPAELAMQQEGALAREVTFSLVCVLHDVTPDQLHDMVDAVLAQSYGHLELVLVNSAPHDRRLQAAVREVELADARVRSVPQAADFGLASATSAGIDAATGEYVCLLREGDLLEPDTLWCLAAVVQANADADVIYTDEDRLEHGRHVQPLFKPDWDPDLLLGTNYLGNLCAMRKSLLADMGTMDGELDGACDHYLALHATDRAAYVCHVPRVLYHAHERTGKRAATTADLASGLVAVRRHLADAHIPASARASARVPYGCEVSFGVGEEEPPLVSVLIVNRDGVTSLRRCLESLLALTAYERFEVIIVEQGSEQPETFDYYREAEAADERVRTVFFQGDAFGWGQLVNFGATRAHGEYLLLLSPDVEITDGTWMGRLVSLCARQGVGAAGVRLVRKDGTIASSGSFLSTRGPIELDRYRLASEGETLALQLTHGVSMASGDCLMVEMPSFVQMAGISEAFAVRYGDAELCLRLRQAGYRVVVDPQVVLTLHRPIEADDADVTRTDVRQAMGRLWDSWPYGPCSVDPTVGPNVDRHSAYRVLPV